MAALPIERVEDRGRIGDYEIVNELSRSSVTSVYEGYQASLDRTVLIKRLHPQLADDEDLRARFEREAKALARIKHKNIVHIYDYQASKESVHLVTEFISGGSLAERLKKLGPLTEREAVAVAVDVLEGLRVAHKSGIIHRDIKPGNIMVSHTGQIKITDFGLAQYEGAPSLTMQGMVIGTPAYIAPEVVSGNPAGSRSDLFSLGISLYELMTGVNPFLADNMSETLNRIISKKAPELEGVNPEMQRLLARLMEKKPDRRYQTAEEALAEITPLAEKYQVDRGWIDVEPDGPALRTETRADSDSLIQPRRAKSRLRFWIPGSILAVLLAAVLIFTLVDRTEEPVEPPLQPPADSLDMVQPPVAADTSAQASRDTTVEQEPQQQARDEDPSLDDQRAAPPSEPRRQVAGQPVEEPRDTTALISTETQSDETEVAMADEQDESDDEQATPSEPEPVRGEGYLDLHVTPWANVYDADGRFLVQTPTDDLIKTNAGEVRLTFSNPDLPPITRLVTIPQSDTVRMTIDLMSMVGEISFIDASPWARVYLDGEELAVTPIYRRILLPFGEHTLRFEHPDLPTKVETIVLKHGDPPRSITVDMTK